MKRSAVLTALLLGTFCMSFAQNYDFNTFETLMESRDTAAIRQMLDEWEPKNADYYAAAFNYSIISAGSQDEALHAFDIVKEGIAGYPDRLDLRFGMVYAQLMVEDYPAVLSGLEDVLSRNAENGGEWLWMNDEPQEDSRNTLLSGIDEYLSAMRDAGQQEQVDEWIDLAAEANPSLKNGFLVIKERWLSGEWETEQAMAILRSILEEDPDYEAALFDYAYMSYMSNDYDTAVEYFGRLAEISEDEEDREMMESYIEICRQEQAREYFPPHMDEMERFVKNNRRQYDALSARFAAADSTLTDEEIRRVYYGYAFTEAYSPLADYSTMVNALIKEDKLDEAKDVAEGLLEKYPVSLWLLRQLFIISMELEEDTDSYQQRYIRLIDSILSTGNGRSPAKAIHVISTTDEYEILNEAFGMQELGSQSLVEDLGSAFDLMKFVNPYDDAVALYFNVDLLFRKYNEMFDSDL